MKILCRPAGSMLTLAESMDHVREFDSIKDMIRAIANSLHITEDDVYIKYYGYDRRIGWDTYLVCVGKALDRDYMKEYGYPQADSFFTIKEKDEVALWIMSANEISYWYTCSNCGARWMVDSERPVCKKTAFCYRCGRKMINGVED